MKDRLKIGLFGYGVVGRGLYDVLQSTPAFDASIDKIVVKNRKERNLPEAMFYYDPDDILDDPDINVVVEVIDNAEDAYHIVKKALKKGKHVVSANKKMLAEHMAEMIELQKENNVSLLYEASACGSIPIIRSLEEYYDNDLLLSVTGILNGSSNYILSNVFDHDQSYQEALKEAQDLGFAESDPSFDVEGYDSLYKLIIITLHSFGTVVKPENVLTFGISNINEFDINYAKEKRYKIKLVGQVERLHGQNISLYVLPRFVGRDKYIYSVEEEFNGVVVKGKAYDKQFMFGKGAGGHPTSSAVLSDITALAHGYKYEYKKLNYFKEFTYFKESTIEIYLRYSDDKILEYFRFESISEEYKGPKYNYRIGFVKLSDLIKTNDKLRELDLFIALTGKKLNY